MPFPALANPRAARRVATGVLLLGGLLAGMGTAIRAWRSGSDDQWTFLLDATGLLIVLVGAGLDVRVTARFVAFDERGSRRRALMQIVFGTLAAAVGCGSLGWLASESWPALVRGGIALLLNLGIGVGLAGLLYFGWFSGGDYLERRIAQRSEEEW